MLLCMGGAFRDTKIHGSSQGVMDRHNKDSMGIKSHIVPRGTSCGDNPKP